MVEDTFINDHAALLRLESRSALLYPQFLHDQTFLSDGQRVVAAGWGSKTPSLGGPIFSDLRIEMNRYLTAATCNRPHLWNGSVAEEHVCGINEEGRASCVGECVLFLWGFFGNLFIFLELRILFGTLQEYRAQLTCPERNHWGVLTSVSKDTDFGFRRTDCCAKALPYLCEHRVQRPLTLESGRLVLSRFDTQVSVF